nr:hypothetical protein CFP56_73576 [Quercus suber]
MTRSKAHLHGLGEEEERGEGKDTAHEGGSMMKILITSPLILKTWKPHLHCLWSSHRHSLKDSHMHLLMLPIASTCFLIDSTISMFIGGYAMDVG